MLRVFPSPPLLLSAQSCVPPFVPKTEKTDVPGDCVLSPLLWKKRERKRHEGTEMLLESGGNEQGCWEVGANVQ